MSDVKPAVGQVWQDIDSRIRTERDCARLVQITSIDGDKVVCQAWYDEAGSQSRTVRIKLARFKPTSSGYRFVRDESGRSS